MRCHLCGEQLGRRRKVDTGPDLGIVHRKCFNAWDDEDQAATMLAVRALALPVEEEAEDAAA